MKAVVVEKPDVLSVKDVPEVEFDEYQALVRTLACSICNGTDSKILHGTIPFLPPDIYPGILGHESVGRVVKTGSKVRNFREGDLVFRSVADVAGYSCFWGGFAEQGTVTDLQALAADGLDAGGRQAHSGQQVIPDEVDPIEATVCITLKEIMSYLRALDAEAGRSLLVLGYGPVGLAAIYLGKVLGMGPVIVAGRREEGLRLANTFGADECFNTGADFVRSVIDATDGGADFIVDATGNAELVDRSAAALAEDGKMGLYAIVDRGQRQREGRNVAAVNPDESLAHDEIMRLWSSGKIQPDRFVSHALPMSEISTGFDLIDRREAIKVAINTGA